MKTNDELIKISDKDMQWMGELAGALLPILAEVYRRGMGAGLEIAKQLIREEA